MKGWSNGGFLFYRWDTSISHYIVSNFMLFGFSYWSIRRSSTNWLKRTRSCAKFSSKSLMFHQKSSKQAAIKDGNLIAHVPTVLSAGDGAGNPADDNMQWRKINLVVPVLTVLNASHETIRAVSSAKFSRRLAMKISTPVLVVLLHQKVIPRHVSHDFHVAIVSATWGNKNIWVHVLHYEFNVYLQNFLREFLMQLYTL